MRHHTLSHCDTVILCPFWALKISGDGENSGWLPQNVKLLIFALFFIRWWSNRQSDTKVEFVILWKNIKHLRTPCFRQSQILWIRTCSEIAAHHLASKKQETLADIGGPQLHHQVVEKTQTLVPFFSFWMIVTMLYDKIYPNNIVEATLCFQRRPNTEISESRELGHCFSVQFPCHKLLRGWTEADVLLSVCSLLSNWHTSMGPFVFPHLAYRRPLKLNNPNCDVLNLFQKQKQKRRIS